MTQMTDVRLDESSLREQVRGILREVLGGTRLSEDSKDRLRLLIARYPERPERALAEHFQALRKEALRKDALAGELISV